MLVLLLLTYHLRAIVDNIMENDFVLIDIVSYSQSDRVLPTIHCINVSQLTVCFCSRDRFMRD